MIRKTPDSGLPRLSLATVSLLLCLAASLLPACGPRLVKDQAPFVQVNTWRIDGITLSADLRIRNVNDEPLPVDRIELKVMLDETLLVEYSGTHAADVSANGFETLNLEMQASEEGTEMLASLQAGEIASLPYRLDGRVRTPTGISYPFEREGHIYTVPGRPGQFR